MTWQKDAVVYQIYPRSFQDSNGDGIGDLQGIISRLDHLSDLGVDVIWLSPIYDSPNDDNGYDIRNYQQVLPEYGTLQDFDELLAEAHQRGLKIMMDLVVNHTSDEHPWFREAASNPQSEKRDYYIWRSGKDGQRPNQWQAAFGGPAWDQVNGEGEHYLHLFSKKQPDLNWENPRLRQEIYQMMRWWLDRGVDGFRMDVINLISKDPHFPEGTPIPGTSLTDGSRYYANGPRLQEHLREMHQEVLCHYDTITVGEMPFVTPEQALQYTLPQNRQLQMVFQFDHVSLGDGPQGKWNHGPWSLPELKHILNRWQTGLLEGGWNSLYWNNHDQPRAVSRFGSEKHRTESAKALATTLMFMRGTPYIYQGEELGMTNVKFDALDDYRDIESLNAYRDLTTMHGWTHGQALQALHHRSRDNARTPMQWTAGPGAGFTEGTPWIRVNPNHTSINAECEVKNPHSVYHHYRKLIQLRKSETVVRDGGFQLLDPDHPTIFAYLREDDHARLLVVSNFSHSSTLYSLPDAFCSDPHLQLLINTDPAPLDLKPVICLKPFQSLVLKTHMEERR